MPQLQANILIADPSLFIREGLQEALQKPGYAIETAAHGAQVRRMLKAGNFHLAILDLQMPGPAGMRLLQEVGQHHPDTLCIILTAHDNVHTAVEAMRKGAYDVVTKPVDLDNLRLVVSRALDRFELVVENRKLHHRLEKEAPFRRLVRRSPAMQAAAATIKQVAETDVPVLLRGETGVGKDLVARAIHDRSKRRDAPFVAVNCGGFTEELFTSELFGHKRGAFTSAHADRPGRFTLAEGGTLFLDEIGEVSHKNQVELLRVLESHEFQPLGDPQVRRADVRIIAATNRDLEDAVATGGFRKDLYYRLNVIPIDIPPLRQRREDIPVLVEMCLDETCRAQNKPAKKISPEAMEGLIAYNWPGNVRQLRNLLQRLVVTTSAAVILPQHLPGPLGELATDGPGQFSMALGSSLQEVEAELIRQTLQRLTGNRREAAAILGISVRSLQYKIKQYNITTK